MYTYVCVYVCMHVNLLSAISVAFVYMCLVMRAAFCKTHPWRKRILPEHPLTACRSSFRESALWTFPPVYVTIMTSVVSNHGVNAGNHMAEISRAEDTENTVLQPSFWLLQSVYPFFHDFSLSVGCRGCLIDVLLGAGNPMVSYSLHFD